MIQILANFILQYFVGKLQIIPPHESKLLQPLLQEKVLLPRYQPDSGTHPPTVCMYLYVMIGHIRLYR